MTRKLILTVLAALSLSGCANLGCSAANRNGQGGGGCSAHVPF